ncbi:hypothetical protein EST38_g6861 [Candolleomyces aberdarensis]|uniref:Uncharacterized protein n=1 Tax=Candolleomyces aberdarensis TaxID=2316362 RepID=A0A4Q2DIN2_9AGAR|nr:hypothetical protein EST38_g6861 [Candolleomyces aberdarensis]
MEQDSPSSARKPLALLSKLKRQASALVKPGTSTPASPVGTTFPSSGWEDTAVATTRFPTVSFAPTPVPSISTFPTSSSIALSRPSSSSARSDANSSFLDCGDSDEDRPRRSFTASFSTRRKAKQDKTVPALTLFQNRNYHLDSQSDMNASQDDARSMATLDTVETTNTLETDGGLSTESGDYIPYIPLVLRLEHERKLAKMQRMAGASSEGVATSSMMNIIPATGRRTVQADIHARSTPSPTPSFSTVESVSTESPDTPRTPVFYSESTPSISINSEELEEDDNEDLFSITSSFAPGDEFEYPPNVQQNQPKLSSVKPEQPFAEDVFSQDDSYEAPSEMYRRSRMESLVLPNPKFNALRYSSFSDDVDMLKSTKTKTPLEDERSRSSAPIVYTSPPDIRVEAASILTADPSTPTAADHFHSNPNGLLPPSPPKAPNSQKPHYQIGFGRQTVDPRAGKQGDSEPGEWTLLLGEEKETSFARARKASQSQNNAAGNRKRSTGPPTGQERSRKKSGISVTLKATETGEVGAGAALSPSKRSVSMPFAAEPHVQKPLHRVKSLFDMEGSGRTELDGQETSDAEADLKTAGSDPGPGLRRSGSAHPVLDGGKKPRSPTSGTPDDWTLMLPLPFPRQFKKSAAASTRPQGDERKTRVIHKARSSVDLASTVVLHVRKRKVSSPMLSGKNFAFAQQQQQKRAEVEEPQQPLQHKKELSAEEMLAVILDLNDGDDASKLGEGKLGNASAGGQLDREDHRQKALDMLSGNSTPSSGGSQPRTRDTSLSPKSAVGQKEENDEDRSVSPSPSFAKFEERLCELMDRQEFGAGPSVEDLAESQHSSQPTEKDEAAAESDPSLEQVNQPLSTSLPLSPIDIPSPLKTAPKPTSFPFPSLKPKSNRPLYPIGSKPTSTMSLPPPPPASTSAPRATASRSQSLTAHPPRVVSRSSLFGLSFSQYGPNPVPSIKEANRPSLDSQARPSGSINSTTPLVMSRSSFAAERSRPTTSEGVARQTPPLVIKIPNDMRQGDDDNVEEPTPSHLLISSPSMESIRSVSSVSSIETVVPSGKNRSFENLSVSTSDSEQALSPRSPFLLEDFPLPPASLPLNGVVPAESTPESSPKKPVVTTLNLIQRAGEASPLARFPGADEDTEIPPPTPIGTSSPHRSPPRSTPSPYIFGVVDTSVSLWMDDEDEDEDEVVEEEYTSDTSDSSGTETEYEDARSTFGMSDEDYEDAVSMLSGVFYSARNSLDG